MRIKEFITEWAYTNHNIKKILLSKGYQYLSAGVDQSAYLEPGTGQVLKIFGTANLGDRTKFTKDHMMFKYWVEYCDKNAANPFLPKFSGWESFEFDGAKYLQIRMEKLRHCPDHLGRLLSYFSNDTYGSRAERADKVAARKDQVGDDHDPYYAASEESRDAPHRVANSELAIFLGEEEYDLLKKTIAELDDIAKVHNWEFDLHSANYMQRGDGYPVIVDPWVVAF
jgi:hypothetical protein